MCHCAQGRGDRYGEDDAEAGREAFHDFNADGIGVDELQVRQVVGVVQEPYAEGSAEEGQDEGRRHGAHDVAADVHACREQGLAADVRLVPFQFCTGSGHVHGDVHNGAEAGEEDGRQAGCQDAAQGRPKSSQALFRPTVDEVHRRSQDDDRRDDGRCDGTHTAQDHGEKEEEDAHGADVGRNNDDRHPGLADGPKEKTVRAIRLNGLSGIEAIFHTQGDDLIAHTASVFLQIIADNIDDAGFFKDPAIAVDQLRLIDLVILPEEEAAGHHQHDDDDQAEPAGVDHAQSLTMLYVR